MSAFWMVEVKAHICWFNHHVSNFCAGVEPLTEVLPPEAVALCRAKAPDAFVLLDAAHGFFSELAAELGEQHLQLKHRDDDHSYRNIQKISREIIQRNHPLCPAGGSPRPALEVDRAST